MLNIKAGERFGKWVTSGEFMMKPNRTKSLLCRCDCGSEKYVDQGALIYGRSTSCGCVRTVSVGTRALLRERSTGQIKSDEAKRKISEANTGRKKPEGWTAWTPERIARQQNKIKES